MNIVRENFKSLHEMMATLGSRKNNEPMRGENSSTSNGKSFTGTESYKEAEQLMAHGYTKILPEIKKGMVQANASTSPMQRRRVTTGVQGYAPHVPNAIQGLPNSMIRTESQIQKVKAVSIVYNMTQNAGTNEREFTKCGIVILSLVNKLELSGCRVNLKIACMTTKSRNELAICTVDVKSYAEHLDLQKLTFPVAHPSMFRRFGFKWLETVPTLTESCFSSGYGRSVGCDDSSLMDAMKLNDETMIDIPMIQRANYDVDKLLEKTKLNK